MAEQLIDLAVVRIDGDTQPRTAINPGIVQEYAEAIEAGVEFPAVTVVHDGATHWLVDGFHRFFAHRRLNRPQIKAEVIAGELADARWLSVAANKAHGLRRTNGDKAKAVVRAMKLKPDLSNPALAEHVGVSVEMVRRYREVLERQLATVASSPAQQATAPKAQLTAGPQTRVGRDGKHRRVQRRRGRAAAISRNAHQPVRNGRPMPAMTALNMPHDPLMGARALIGQFSADYLHALVAFLSKHLEGAAV